MWTDAGWFLLGLAALVIGAEVMVRGGAEVAARLGISPIVIGLTVVSIGTSLPELAVLRGSRDIAIGNLLGSSIYNILLILGVTSVVADGLVLPDSLVRIDIPIMVAVALACIPIFVTGRRVSRPEGGAMVRRVCGLPVDCSDHPVLAGFGAPTSAQ